jgi:hypothetical protein
MAGGPDEHGQRRVSTGPGDLTPLHDILQRLQHFGERCRVQLRSAERDVAAIRSEFGIDIAQAAADEAHKALSLADHALASCQATTPAGLALKLRTIAPGLGWGDSGIRDDDEVDFFSGILADLERMSAVPSRAPHTRAPAHGAA